MNDVEWLTVLVAPGASLGGARPKANFTEADGSLWIAKFPARDDAVRHVEFIDKVMHIDDPVGAVSVHMVNGVFGTLAVGLFASPAYIASSGAACEAGLFYGGGLHQLGVQAAGVGAVGAWVVATCAVLFWVLKKVGMLRVTREEELRGLDIGEHGMEGYNGFQIFVTE